MLEDMEKIWALRDIIPDPNCYGQKTEGIEWREKNYSLVQRAVTWSIKFGKNDWSISKQIWT